jgi:hypothetical protein
MLDAADELDPWPTERPYEVTVMHDLVRGVVFLVGPNGDKILMLPPSLFVPLEIRGLRH